MKLPQYVARGLALLSFVFLLSCRTPPDITPFTQATSDLSASIKTAGRTVSSEVDSMTAAWPAPQRAKAEEIIAKFEKQWTQRNALADALLEYSASLTAIVQAGEQGEKSARALADSFQKLCGSIGLAMPPAAGAGAAVDLGAQLYGKFARNYAAKTLGKGMKELQPAIDETAVELAHSLEQIKTALDAIRDQIDANIAGEVLNGVGVGTHRNTAKTLAVRRENLLRSLASGDAKRDQLLTDLLGNSDGDKAKELARLGSLRSEIAAELATIESSLKSELELLGPVEARLGSEKQRLTTEIELVQTIQAGLHDWAAAHSRIAAAALEKKPLQVEDLIQTATQIQDLVETIRADRKKE
jgi:hypothetical protein